MTKTGIMFAIGVVAIGVGLAVNVGTKATVGSSTRDRPNILFIMADDLGFADLSSFGRRDYETPHIDSLADQGMRLTSAYSNSPVCSPTRTALMTGNYQYRVPVGLEEPVGFRDVGLETDFPTLPERLKELGYQTALVGKWHLGDIPKYSPLKNGYDHFWGTSFGGVHYFTYELGGVKDLWDGETLIEKTGYLTELLGDQSIKLLEEFATDGGPFYLSLHFTAPHWPWEGPNDQEAAVARSSAKSIPNALHYDGGNMAIYAEMVASLDGQVGRVLESLKRLGLRDNTIVVFTSDNGGERFSDTWPFTGLKSELLEGGIRVPTIVRWPGRTSPGSESAEPMMTMDWVPTFLGAAGYDDSATDKFDGLDVAAMFDGKKLPERSLHWRYNIHEQKAVRRGRWKYLEIAGNEFLFDIVADPMERGNLKGHHPEIFRSLKREFENWNQSMLPYTDESYSGVQNGAGLAEYYGIRMSEAVKGVVGEMPQRQLDNADHEQ